MEKQMQRIRDRADAMRDRIDDMCQRRARDAQDGVSDIAGRVRSFLDDSDLGNETRQRWENWLTEKQQSFERNMENASYCHAWHEYGEIQNKVTDLAFRYRQKMAAAYQNMVRQETRLSKAVETLRETAASIRQKIADAA